MKDKVKNKLRNKAKINKIRLKNNRKSAKLNRVLKKFHKKIKFSQYKTYVQSR